MLHGIQLYKPRKHAKLGQRCCSIPIRDLFMTACHVVTLLRTRYLQSIDFKSSSGFGQKALASLIGINGHHSVSLELGIAKMIL